MKTYTIRSRRERVWQFVGLATVSAVLIALTVATACAGPAEQPVEGHWQDIEGATFAWAIALLCLYVTLAMPFEILLADDGAVTFRSLLRDTTVSVHEIRSICCRPTSPGLTPWPTRRKALIMISRLGSRSANVFDADLLSFHSFIARVHSLNPSVELWLAGTGSLGLGMHRVRVDELWENA